MVYPECDIVLLATTTTAKNGLGAKTQLQNSHGYSPEINGFLSLENMTTHSFMTQFMKFSLEFPFLLIENQLLRNPIGPCNPLSYLNTLLFMYSKSILHFFIMSSHEKTCLIKTLVQCQELYANSGNMKPARNEYDGSYPPLLEKTLSFLEDLDVENI